MLGFCGLELCKQVHVLKDTPTSSRDLLLCNKLDVFGKEYTVPVGGGLYVTTIFAPRRPLCMPKVFSWNMYDALSMLVPEYNLCGASLGGGGVEEFLIPIKPLRKGDKARVGGGDWADVFTNFTKSSEGLWVKSGGQGGTVVTAGGATLRAPGVAGEVLEPSWAERRTQELRGRIARRADTEVRFVYSNVDGLNSSKFLSIARTQRRFEVVLLAETKLESLGHLQHPGWAVFGEPCEQGRGGMRQGGWLSWCKARLQGFTAGCRPHSQGKL